MILASTSPRRKELLEKLGFKIKIITIENDEKSDKENIVDKVKEIAYNKAFLVAKDYRENYVIGADTIVVVDNIILGKPKTLIEAKEMLKLLSGRDHNVITAYSLINIKKGIEIVEAVTSKVYFKELSEKEIRWYLANEMVLDKAGGYGIQGLASIFINKIEGDYFSIMGFPVNSFVQNLKSIGITVDDFDKI